MHSARPRRTVDSMTSEPIYEGEMHSARPRRTVDSSTDVPIYEEAPMEAQPASLPEGGDSDYESSGDELSEPGGAESAPVGIGPPAESFTIFTHRSPGQAEFPEATPSATCEPSASEFPEEKWEPAEFPQSKADRPVLPGLNLAAKLTQSAADEGKAVEERLAAEAADAARQAFLAAEAEEAARKAEEERLAAEAGEAARQAAEAARQAEEERLAAESAEAARQAVEAARQAEEERLAAEAGEAARQAAEAARQAAEAARQAEEERLAAESAQAARQAVEAARQAEEERLAAEAAEAARQLSGDSVARESDLGPLPFGDLAAPESDLGPLPFRDLDDTLACSPALRTVEPRLGSLDDTVASSPAMPGVEPRFSVMEPRPSEMSRATVDAGEFSVEVEVATAPASPAGSSSGDGPFSPEAEARSLGQSFGSLSPSQGAGSASYASGHLASEAGYMAQQSRTLQSAYPQRSMADTSDPLSMSSTSYFRPWAQPRADPLSMSLRPLGAVPEADGRPEPQARPQRAVPGPFPQARGAVVQQKLHQVADDIDAVRRSVEEIKQRPKIHPGELQQVHCKII